MVNGLVLGGWKRKHRSCLGRELLLAGGLMESGRNYPLRVGDGGVIVRVSCYLLLSLEVISGFGSSKLPYS